MKYVGLIAEVHEWFSWLFLLGCGGHILANIHPLKNQLRTRWGKISLLMFTAVLAASFFSWGFITPAQLKRPIERALVEAPLSALAMVTHTDPGALIDTLKAHGIDATGNQSIHDLVILHEVDEDRLLGIVFLSE